jgi:hypothetical protein
MHYGRPCVNNTLVCYQLLYNLKEIQKLLEAIADAKGVIICIHSLQFRTHWERNKEGKLAGDEKVSHSKRNKNYNFSLF